ncbi:MAG: hypothetical protein ACOX69_08060 [Coriobacteriales bacterium]|jgi:hypothetical protein
MGDFGGLGFGGDGFGADDFAKINLGSQMFDDVDDISPGREFDQPDLYKKYWGEDEANEGKEIGDDSGEESSDFYDLDGLDEADDNSSDECESEDRDQLLENYEWNMELLDDMRDKIRRKGFNPDDFTCDNCDLLLPLPDAESLFGGICASFVDVKEAIEQAHAINKEYPFDADDLRNKTPGAFCWYMFNDIVAW